MNRITQNKVAMYKAVRSTLAKHKGIWESIPAFSQSHSAFIEKLRALEQNAFEQSFALIGISAAKDAKKQIVAEKTYAISSGILAYAVINNNSTLIELMNIGKKVIFQASKAKLIQIVDRVIANGTEFGDDLAEFGVTSEKISELHDLRDELEMILNSPRNAIIARKGYTQQIAKTRKELDQILKMQIDKLMLVLEFEHPDFFAEYKNARIIIDFRNGKRENNDSSNSLDYGEE